MGLLISLQDFADGNSDEHLTPPPETLPGYDAGYAAGEAASRGQQEAVDAALVQSLEDLSFGFAEARQVVLQSLTPLFSALADHVLPASVDPSLRMKLVEHLLSAAKEDVNQPCILEVHPAQVEPVNAILAKMGLTDVTVSARADQLEHGVMIKRGNVETTLDADTVIADLTAILRAFFDMNQEQVHHG